MDKLLEYMEKQGQFNQKLIERLDAQEKYIKRQNEYIEERDEKLMESVRTVQGTKQEFLQIAAAKEEEKAKAGFFARLFGK
ncbi:DUF3967 domain-containing protein [Priestia megaterium]|uniref:DUF3967 domain-containing protein n=1 Tax=Priestia megaterium TaxID=1404 RepID=UPI0015A9572E|nr:DUF3967 domain-containing protein [Priestia megaterium]QLC90712.1 DUF3967 domain-containing protein [Priestia megaterium]